MAYTVDQQLSEPPSGQANWDSDWDANMGILERGYHTTAQAGIAINTGNVCWMNSGGFLFPFNPNSTTPNPQYFTFTAAASGDSVQVLAQGIVRSLGITSFSVAGKPLYVSALTPGIIVNSPASGEARRVGWGIKGGIFFNPYPLGGSGSSTLAALTDVNTNGVADGKTLTWADASSKWIPTTPATGVTKLAALTDVNTNGVADGKTLTWADASSKWIPATPAGGFSPGTTPVFVQVIHNTSGNFGTFVTTPTSGNLLVAMTFNPTLATAGTGWTQQVSNGSGLDFGAIFTKVCAGELLNQFPLANSGNTGGIVIWEFSGQSATPFLTGIVAAEGSGTTATPQLLPNVSGCVGLAAISATSSISAAKNLGTQDVLDNSGARCLAAGHTDLSKTPMDGVLATFFTSASYKGATCLITA